MISLPSQPNPPTAAPEGNPHPLQTPGKRLALRLATIEDRERIYRLRHEVFARELHQYPANAEQRLSDALDAFNVYIVAWDGNRIAGFVSVTPPGPKYSIDKYFERQTLPFAIDDKLYEIRLLTVLPDYRSSLLSLGLMYAAFRWAEARGGNRIVAIGRREVLSLYFKVGLEKVGLCAQAGAVTYDLLLGTTPGIHLALTKIHRLMDRVEATTDWEIGVAFRSPATCYHGGDFFSAVGDEFTSLERLNSIISADVLDAWFPPAPRAIAAVQEHLPRLLQTSPPTGGEGLVRAIARARGVKAENILPGAGSSDLIFLALRQWLTPGSRVLILDPTYGEYIHVLERVVGCQVERLVLERSAAYRLDPARLLQQFAKGCQLMVLVNPNSPTGQHVPRSELEPVLRRIPPTTRVWIDETYVDYAGPDESVEKYAAESENVIVCKSMSKTYALSGARAAYLCAGPHQLEGLRPLVPPWAVSLPAQVAAIRALEETGYYAARYRETHVLREELQEALRALGWDVLPGVANFLLCHLPPDGPDSATLIARCREQGLFLRNTADMGTRLGNRALRIAVKDAATNRRMLKIIRDALRH